MNGPIGQTIGSGSGTILMNSERLTLYEQVIEINNLRLNSATLVAGAVSVAVPSVEAGELCLVTMITPGGTPGFLSATVTAGVGIDITSTSALDTSTVAWLVLKPIFIP